MSTTGEELVGVLPPFIRRTLGVRSPRRFRYDTLVRVRAGEPVFLLTHPDDVRHVLVGNAEGYTKTPRLVGASGRRRVGHGVLTATGGEHLRQRRLLQPLFRREAVTVIAGAVEDVVDRALDRWHASSRVDLASEMESVAKGVILTTLFGRDLDEDAYGSLARDIAVRRRYTELVHHGRLPFRDRLPTPVVRAHREALARLDTTIGEAVAVRRAAPHERDDLLARLLQATYDDGSTMPERLVRDEALTLMTTGYETLGEALMWVFVLLGHHPDADEAVAAEASRVALAAAGVEHLPVTERVLSEALRLYPPTWLDARVPRGDDVLPVGGKVRSGSTLYVCPYVLHRHPRLFQEPERFDPQRFAPDARLPRYVYLPFGDGLHRCLGEHLARLEAVLVIARVARQVRLVPDSGRPVVPRAGVTLGARRPVWARPAPRRIGTAA